MKDEEIEVLKNILFENYSKEQLFEIFKKIDFNSILDLAYETKVFNIVYDIISPYGKMNFENLKRKKLYELKYKKHDEVMMDIVNIFNDEHINYAIVKGDALGYIIYGKNIRQYSDIDIFVSKKDLAKCKRILEFNLYKEIHGDFLSDYDNNINKVDELVFVNIDNDVKFEVKCFDFLVNDKIVEEFLLNTLDCNNKYKVLSNEDAFIYLIITAYKNMQYYYDEYSLKDVTDIYYFIKNVDYNYEKILSFFEQNNLLNILDFVFSTVNRLAPKLNLTDIGKEYKIKNQIYHFMVENDMMKTIVKRKERLQVGKCGHAAYINQCGIAKIFKVRKNKENIINIFGNVKMKIWAFDDRLQFEIVDFDDEDGAYYINMHFMQKNICTYLYGNVCFEKNNGVISSDFDEETTEKNLLYYDDILFDKNAYFYATMVSKDGHNMYDSIGYTYIPAILSIE